MATVLSCIMPVYNAAEYLDAAVESILSQSWPYFELLLIDDGSTDESGALCDKWNRQDDRVRVKHQVNKGVAAARNTGLSLAQGRILCFVDADDVLKAGAFAAILPAFDNRGRDLVSFGYEYILPEGSKTVQHPAFVCESREEFWPHFLPFYKEGLFFSLCNKAYRADIIKENGLTFHEDRRTGEDLAFNLAYFSLAGSLEHLDAVYYEYRSHPVTLTRSATLDNMEISRGVLHQVRDFLMENGQAELYPQLVASQLPWDAANFFDLLTDSSKPYTLQERREGLEKLFGDDLWYTALLTELERREGRYAKFLCFAAKRKNLFLATLPARLRGCK